MATAPTRTCRPLKIREAADRLGCGWKRVHSLIQSGALPAFRLTPSGPYRIQEADLDWFIESQRFIPKGDGS